MGIFITQPSESNTRRITNTKTMNASNTTAHIPLFRITGTVRIVKIYACVMTQLGTNHTAAGFRVNDQSGTDQITSVAGTNVSTAPVGSHFSRDGLAAAAMKYYSSAAGTVNDPGSAGISDMTEFCIIAKNGANTDIEYSYTTTENPTSGSVEFVCEYQLMSTGSSMTSL